MTIERQARIAALFDEAVSGPRDVRERLVERVARDDAALADELESLLSASDAAEEYFDKVAEEAIGPALTAVAAASDESTPDELALRLEHALGSTYRIERELGGGGMSRVFLATEVRLDRRVVIKILPEELALGVSVERFRREIQLSARLQHPHIVPVLATDAADGLVYYAMPYVAGETLRSRIAREGALPFTDALAIWRDVLDALAYAHACGVVHRDIKPENILLGGRNALVADFGIARAVEAAAGEANVTATGVTLGTPAYMAPEQVAGEGAIDQRIDIYAVGLVMYEMLAGRPPFAGLGARQVLLAHLTQPPPPITRPDLPTTLTALVLRCLAKDPDERPPSAESILQQVDQTVVAPAPVPRPKWLVWTGAAAAVILLAAAVVIGRSTSQRDARASESAGSITDVRSTDSRPSIAVLPLEVLTADSVSEFLADMLTAALIDKFTEAGDLRVVQGPSSFFFKGHRSRPRAIADSLHVGNVLTGAVHTEGSAVRVLLRLINGTDESVRWTQMYKGERDDMFALEDSIEGSVSRQLRPSLVRSYRRARAKPDPAAHELYRRARYDQDLGLGAVRSAINYLTQAVAKDPGYAEAYAALAETYGTIATGNVSDFPYRVAVDSAHYFAERAIALDDSLPEAYEARAFIRILFDFDWAGAEADGRRAVQLNPYYSRRSTVRAVMYWWRGDFKRAITELRLDLAADPMSPNTRAELARAFLYNGQYDAALAHLDTAISLAGARNAPRIYLTFGEINLNRGRYPEATANFQRILEATPASPLPRAFLAVAYARGGDSARAAQQLNDLLARWRTGRSNAQYVAIAYAGLKDYDHAFAWLDSAYKDRSLRPLLMSPTFRELRRDPRFETLLRRMGLRT